MGYVVYARTVLSTVHPHHARAGAPRSREPAAGRRVEGGDLTPVRLQREHAAGELGAGDDVAVGHPPAHLTVRQERDGLDLVTVSPHRSTEIDCEYLGTSAIGVPS